MTMTPTTPPKGWPWAPDQDSARHQLIISPNRRRSLIALGALLVVVALGGLGLYFALASGGPQVTSEAHDSVTPIPPATASAAPEPTRTGVPEPGPDTELVVDGSNVVAGRHFVPGRYSTVTDAAKGCTWRITTDKGAVIKASGGTGPMTTPTIREGQWFTTYGCGDWELRQP